ncbi:hypothetical protein L6452_17043 [Arctium lappa]|uniref:Uncharacterized protein n=1 Tax=Arctium lappa TaxID=4217 RepID=A0ACB9C2D0_ARCLA|nr:hypothetical protein L6452_17043 [Arctium lappa]
MNLCVCVCVKAKTWLWWWWWWWYYGLCFLHVVYYSLFAIDLLNHVVTTTLGLIISKIDFFFSFRLKAKTPLSSRQTFFLMSRRSNHLQLIPFDQQIQPDAVHIPPPAAKFLLDSKHRRHQIFF